MSAIRINTCVTELGARRRWWRAKLHTTVQEPGVPTAYLLDVEPTGAIERVKLSEHVRIESEVADAHNFPNHL